MYSNISQIMLLYKTWRYYNKFDSPKSLGVCYWCVRIRQCGYMEHGLKHISFYVQKQIVAMGMCYNPALVRNKPLGAPESVKLVHSICIFILLETLTLWLHKKVCPQTCDLHQVSIGSGNGLWLIPWINVNEDFWRRISLLGHNELK